MVKIDAMERRETTYYVYYLELRREREGGREREREGVSERNKGL